MTINSILQNLNIKQTYNFNRKYIHQPSYAKAVNLIYHQNREIRLDPDCSYNQSLITTDNLTDFYQMKGVKLFPNTGRELEVDEEPDALYKYHQQDHSTCSEAEKELHQGILQELQKAKKEKDNTIPLMYRIVKDTTLFFNSKFESGNLREVERVSELEYNLYLNFDFNTLNYTQWYYFSVRNIKKDYEYDEDNIACYVYEDDESQMATLNTLSFQYTFEYDNDIVFFSHFQPYTYGDLKDYIYQIKNKGNPDFVKNTLRVQKLCDTIQGVPCLILSISDNVYESNMHKQVIFLTSRVHPGESNSSFMIQGTIDFLMQQNNKDAQTLRELFIFKIIPILNPDGVIKGNYRCNILGVDLNRRWLNPSKLLHPTIYYAKQHAKQSNADHSILMFCDMHGHSRKRNVFMYGCVSGQSDMNQHRNNNLIRLIPYLFSQKSKLFSFSDCKFANEKEKESTARLVLFKEFQVMNSYTLESTFYAPLNKQFKKKQSVDEEFQIKSEDLVNVGIDLCQTFTQILQSKILKKKFVNDLKGDQTNLSNIQINIPQPQILKESNQNFKKESQKEQVSQTQQNGNNNNQNNSAVTQANHSTIKKRSHRFGKAQQVQQTPIFQQAASTQQNFKQQIARPNILEPPTQVDAILIDQFLNIGKAKNSQDIYNRIQINNLKNSMHQSQTPLKKNLKQNQNTIQRGPTNHQKVDKNIPTSQSQSRPQYVNNSLINIQSNDANQILTMSQYQNDVFPNIIKNPSSNKSANSQMRRPITTVANQQSQNLASQQTINHPGKITPYMVTKQQDQQNNTSGKYQNKILYQVSSNFNQNEQQNQIQSHMLTFSNQLSSISNLDLTYNTAAAQMAQNAFQNISVSPAPKMSNPIIQRALEDQASTSGSYQSHNTKQRKPQSQIYQHGVIGSHRRKIIDKLNSFKLFQQSQQAQTNQVNNNNQNPQASQSSSILNTSSTLSALNQFFSNQGTSSQEQLQQNSKPSNNTQQSSIIHQGSIAQSVMRQYQNLNNTQPHISKQLDPSQLSPKNMNLPKLINSSKNGQDYVKQNNNAHHTQLGSDNYQNSNHSYTFGTHTSAVMSGISSILDTSALIQRENQGISRYEMSGSKQAQNQSMTKSKEELQFMQTNEVKQ
eukprot:403370413